MSKLPSGAAKDQASKTSKKTAKAKPDKKPVGAPVQYEPEKYMTLICDRIENGEALSKICKSSGMPSKALVYEWLEQYPELVDKYARACEARADLYANEIIEISDDARNDYMEAFDQEGNAVGYRLNGENIARSRLRVDSRKWLASKLAPKKYGDRTVLEGNKDAPLQIEQKTVFESWEKFEARYSKTTKRVQVDNS